MSNLSLDAQDIIFTPQKDDPLYIFEEKIQQEERYQNIREILNAHNIVLNQISQREEELNKQLVQIERDFKIDTTCDKWDYIFASASGVLAGIIDVLFVGAPQDSKLLSSADNLTNTLVENFAKLNGWDGPKNGSDPLKSATAFLERTFKVNYDQRHSADVSGLFTMSASNHHLKSLAHSPSPIGLVFSILDQFRGTSSFIDNGYLITIDSESNLQGGNFPAKIFAAFCNWIGHIMSDISGSSGSSGRGAGVPVPFYELLLTFNLGNFNVNGERKSLAEVATKVFEKGYDARFGMVCAIPVLMVELFNRIFCILRHHFQYGREWKDCLKFLNGDKSPKLRKMLMAGHGCLCLIDIGDAAVKSGFGSDWIGFFSHLNFVAWGRFAYLGLREAFAILTNEVERQRYRLRAVEYDKYLEDVTRISEQFLAEHNRKVEVFFTERRQEFDRLFGSLVTCQEKRDFVGQTKILAEIGNQYGFKSRFETLDEFDRFMMGDD